MVIDCLETMVKLKVEAAELEDRDLAKKVSLNIVLLAFFGKADINGHPERMQVVIDKLKRFAPTAEKHGFILGLETLLNEADHRHIIESVGSPDLTCLPLTAFMLFPTALVSLSGFISALMPLVSRSTLCHADFL